ncbi:MAG: LamG-like jellyroll fold domain-containing protein [Nanoarchaeota archaeon]
MSYSPDYVRFVDKELGNLHRVITEKRRRRHQRMTGFTALALILAVGLVLFQTDRGFFTGFFLYEENLSAEMPLAIKAASNSSVEIALAGPPTSLSLSGTIIGDGNARVYAQIGSETILLFDSQLIRNASWEAAGSSSSTPTPGPAPPSLLTLDLAYNQGTLWDSDDDGIAFIDSIVDFTVKATTFDESIDTSRVCTRWLVHSFDTGEFSVICNGAADCCNFLGLESSVEAWDEPYNAYVGRHSATANTEVGAQAVFVGNLGEVDNSSWQYLNATFIEPRQWPFSVSCAESCALNASTGNITLIIELDGAELNLTGLSYTYLQRVLSENASSWLAALRLRFSDTGIAFLNVTEQGGIEMESPGIAATITNLTDHLHLFDIGNADPGEGFATRMLILNMSEEGSADIHLEKSGYVDAIMACTDLVGQECFAWSPLAVDFSQDDESIAFTAKGQAAYAGRRADALLLPSIADGQRLAPGNISISVNLTNTTDWSPVQDASCDITVLDEVTPFIFADGLFSATVFLGESEGLPIAFSCTASGISLKRTIILVVAEPVSHEELSHDPIMVNRPVVWRKRITMEQYAANLTVAIPDDIENLTVIAQNVTLHDDSVIVKTGKRNRTLAHFKKELEVRRLASSLQAPTQDEQGGGLLTGAAIGIPRLMRWFLSITGLAVFGDVTLDPQQPVFGDTVSFSLGADEPIAYYPIVDGNATLLDEPQLVLDAPGEYTVVGVTAAGAETPFLLFTVADGNVTVSYLNQSPAQGGDELVPGLGEPNELFIESPPQDLEIVFETPGPVAVEENLSSVQKAIHVVTPYVYDEVSGITAMPELQGKRVAFYRTNSSQKRRVRTIETNDTNNNTLEDEVIYQLTELGNETLLLIHAVPDDVISPDESPAFLVNGTPRDPPSIEFLDAKGRAVNLSHTLRRGSGEYELTIDAGRSLTPGRYLVRSLSGEQLTAFGFLWGVLALNSERSTYPENATSFLSLAVLDSQGHMVCDADLDLVVTRPDGSQELLSVDNGRLRVSPECNVYGYTSEPDYYGYLALGAVGTYRLNLTAYSDEGIQSIQDALQAEAVPGFDVERRGPTRIYPYLPYAMNISITPSEDFRGNIEEYIPLDFVVAPQDGMTVQEKKGAQQLTWRRRISAGETAQFSYEFDAPDFSPALYLVGELDLGGWGESRKWQIASDVGATMPTIGNLVFNSTNGTNFTSENLTVAFTTNDVDGDRVINATDCRVGGESFARLNLPFDHNVSSMALDAVDDISTWNNDATLGNGTGEGNVPSWTPDSPRGGGYQFDGVNDFIAISDALNLPGGDLGACKEMTVMFWIRLNSSQGGTGSSVRMITKRHLVTTDSQSWQCGFSSGIANRFFCGIYQSSGTYQDMPMNSTLTPKAWYHIAWTWNASEGMRFFVNGTLNTSNASGIGDRAVRNSPGVNITIGAQYNSATPFNGTIDDFKIYNYTMTEDQIREIYLGNDRYIPSYELVEGFNYSCNVSVTDTVNADSVMTDNIKIKKRRFLILNPASLADHEIWSSVMGNMTNGSPAGVNHTLTWATYAFGRRVAFDAWFDKGSVNLTNLTIANSYFKVAVNLSNASNLSTKHSVYLKSAGEAGLYVCPAAMVLANVIPACPGVIEFSHAEALAGTTKSGINVSLIGGEYVLANLSGTGVAVNSTPVVNLTYPENLQFPPLFQVPFQCNATSPFNLDNITLWGNFSGSWVEEGVSYPRNVTALPVFGNATFYLPFDYANGSYDGQYAINFSSANFTGAMRSGGLDIGYNASGSSVVYNASGNYNVTNGTIMFWYSPEYGYYGFPEVKNSYVGFWQNGLPASSNYFFLAAYVNDSGGGSYEFRAEWEKLSASISHNSSRVFMNASSWVHVAFTWNNTHSRFFINGTGDAPSTNSPGVTRPVMSGNMTIGRRIGGQTMAGVMDDFLIFNSSLSEDQVFSVYNRTRPMRVMNVTLVESLAGQGDYLWTCSAYDVFNQTGYAANYTLSIDLVSPTINWTPRADDDELALSLTRNWIFLNVTANDSNEQNITFALFNATGLYSNLTNVSGGRSRNFTSLPARDNTYFANVTIVDKASRSKNTSTRIYYMSGPPLSVWPVAPLNATGLAEGAIAFSCNATDDNSIENVSLWANFSGSWQMNQSRNPHEMQANDTRIIFLSHFNKDATPTIGSLVNASGLSFRRGKMQEGVQLNFSSVVIEQNLTYGFPANWNWKNGTISFWYKPAFDSGEWGTYLPGQFAIMRNQSFFFDCHGEADSWGCEWSNNTGASVSFFVAMTAQKGEWHHFLFMWNASGSWIFLNGSLVGSSADTPAVRNMTNVSAGVSIGYWLWDGTPYYGSGVLDEFVVYNESLSWDQVGGLFERGAAFRQANVTFTVEVGEGVYKWGCAAYNNNTFSILPTANFTNEVLGQIIAGVNASPNMTGYGMNVTLFAAMTDGAGVSTAWAEVTAPYGTVTNYSMSNVSGLFFVNVSDWRNGTYRFKVFANDSLGNWQNSSVRTFVVGVNLSVQVRTLKEIYGVGEWVNLTDPPSFVSRVLEEEPDAAISGSESFEREDLLGGWACSSGCGGPVFIGLGVPDGASELWGLTLPVVLRGEMRELVAGAGGDPLIRIAHADYLDKDHKLRRDVTEEVLFSEGQWGPRIYHGESLRVTFEKCLASENDVTVRVRNPQGFRTAIEVFGYPSSVRLAEFPVIWREGNFSVALTALEEPLCTFDLRIRNLDSLSSSYLEFDVVVDAAKTLDVVTLTAPVSDPNVDVSQNFTMNCTWTQVGVGAAEVGAVYFQYSEDGGATNLTIPVSAAGLITPAANPLTGTAAGTYSVNVNGSVAGSYQVSCKVFGTNLGANRSSGHQAVTVVSPSYPVNITLNGNLNADQTISFPAMAVVNGTCAAGSGACYLWANLSGVLVQLASDDGEPFFVQNTTGVGGGSYLYKVNSTQNGTGVSNILSVSKAAGFAVLQVPASLGYGQAVIANCSCNGSSCKLNRNGTDVMATENGTGIILGAGDHYYNCSNDATQNHSFANQTNTLAITQATGAVTLQVPTSSAYAVEVTVNCSCNGSICQLYRNTTNVTSSENGVGTLLNSGDHLYNCSSAATLNHTFKNQTGVLTVETAVLTYTEFDGNGETTDLSFLTEDNANVSGLILDDGVDGKIEFNANVTMNSTFNLDATVQIDYASIYVNSGFYPSMNIAANLTMRGLKMSYPVIKKDGAICTDCQVLSWSSITGTLIFNVSGFSDYTASESNQSKVENLNLTNTSFYLLIYVDKWTGTYWNRTRVVVNDTTPRPILYANGSVLKLDTVFNGLFNTTTNGSGSGFYRVVVNLTNGSDVQLLNRNDSSLSAAYNFTIDVSPPHNITLNYPTSGLTVAGSDINFNWTASDNFDDSMVCNLTVDGVVNVSNVASANHTGTNWTVVGFVNGAHQWNVTCEDEAKNVNVSATYTFTIGSSGPTIASVNISPSTIGYGYNATVQATITDADGVSTAWLEVTAPYGAATNYTMSNTSSWYYANYSDWRNGSYTFQVYANNTNNDWSVSDISNFSVGVNLSVNLSLIDTVFTTDEFVNVTAGSQILNLNLSNTTFYLLMVVDKWTGSYWNTTKVVVNDTAQRAFLYANGSNLSLSSVFNGLFNTTANCSGDGSYRVVVNLTNGSDAQLYNRNDSSLSAATNFTYDTSPPWVNFTGLTPWNGENVSNRKWLYINVTINDSTPVNLTFFLYNETALVTSASTPAGNTSYNFSGMDNNSLYWYNVTASDAVGNTNWTETRVMRIDDHCTYESWETDWNVNTTCLIENRTYTMNGNLTITDAGSLTIKNVTLAFNLTDSFDKQVLVKGGGVLRVDGWYDESAGDPPTIYRGYSNVSTLNQSLKLKFVVEPGGTARINRTNLSDIGASSTDITRQGIIALGNFSLTSSSLVRVYQVWLAVNGSNVTRTHLNGGGQGIAAIVANASQLNLSYNDISYYTNNSYVSYGIIVNGSQSVIANNWLSHIGGDRATTGEGIGILVKNSVGNRLENNTVFDMTDVGSSFVNCIKMSSVNSTLLSGNVFEHIGDQGAGYPTGISITGSNNITIVNTTAVNVGHQVDGISVVSSSNVVISAATLANATNGLTLVGSNFTVIGVTTHNTTQAGLFGLGLNNSYIQDSLFCNATGSSGLRLLNSYNNTFARVGFSSTKCAVDILASGNNTFMDSVISTNGSNDLCANNFSMSIADVPVQNILINSNYSQFQFNPINLNYSWVIKWPIMVYVNRTDGVAVEGALVRGVSANSQFIANSTTNISGWVPRPINLTEKVRNGSGNQTELPSSLTASAVGHINNTVNYSFTGGNETNITLIPHPIVNLSSPADHQVTNANPLTFVCNATDDVDVINITLWGNFSGSWAANDTLNVGAETFNSSQFPLTNLSDGDYLWNCKSYGALKVGKWAASNWTVTSGRSGPSISLINHTPDSQGYGQNITFRATVVDTNSVDDVWISITSPIGPEANYSMALVEGIYQVNLTNWTNGTYSYEIYANDSIGNIDRSSGTDTSYNFSMQLVINLTTSRAVYGVDMIVNLSDNATAWSRVNDTGLTNTSYYLIAKTQYYNGTDWHDEDTVIDDTTARTVFAGNFTALNETWNTALYNVSNLTHGSGLYRVYFSATDRTDILLRDKDGNNISGAVNFTYDASSPNDFAVYLPGNYSFTNLTDINFNWSVQDDTDASLLCNLTLDGAINVSAMTVANGTPTNRTVPGLVEGNHSWNITCIDDGLNRASSPTWWFYIDLSNPVVRIESPDNASWINGASVVLRYNATDPQLDDCVLWANFNSTWAANRTNSTPASGAIDSPSYELLNGTYLWNVWCNDTWGHGAFNATNFTFYLDTSAPNITLHYPLGQFQNWSWVNFNWTTNDIIGLQLYSNITINGTVNVTGIATANETPTNYTVTGFVDGFYVYNLTSYDPANHTNTSVLANFTIDTTQPVVGLVAPLNNSVLVAGAINFVVNATDLYNQSCDLYANFSGSWAVNATSAFRSGLNTTFAITVPEGFYVWNALCNDTAGNKAWNATNFTLRVDGTGPTIASVTESADPIGYGFNITISATITDTNNVSSGVLEVTAPSGRKANVTMVNLSATYFGNFSDWENGTHSYVVFANDSFNNWAVSSPDTFALGVNMTITIRTRNASYPANASVNLTSLSYMENNLSNTSFYLRMFVQKWNGTGWAHEKLMVNDSAQRAVFQANGSVFQLDEVFNGLFNTSTNASGDGYYRVVVNLTNASGEALLNRNGSSLSAAYNFSVDLSPPWNITLIYPADGAVLDNGSVNFNWTAVDNFTSNMLCNLTIDGIVNVSNIGSLNATPTNYTIGGLTGGRHYWNVSCADIVGIANYSTTFSFDVEAVAYLSDCTNISVPGLYWLSADINSSSAHFGSYCINISTDNVTIDCQGHKIVGNDVVDYGIYTAPAAAHSTNITIKNCNVTDWDTAGISYSNANNNTFLNITLYSNPDYGMVFSSANNNTLSNISSFSSATGIMISSSRYLTLNNIFTNSSSESGIEIAGNSGGLIVTNSTITNSSEWDIGFGTDSCAAAANAGITLTNVNGTDNKPIVYFNSSVTIKNYDNNFTEMIFCNADNSVLDNITLRHGEKETNGIILRSTDFSNLSNIYVNDSTDGIFLRGCNNITLTNASFISNLNDALSISQTNNMTVTNVVAQSSGWRGIEISGNLNRIINTTILDTRSSINRIGLYMSSDNNSFENVTISSNGQGIYLDTGADDNTFSNVIVKNSSTPGIHVVTAGQSGDNSISNSLFNNSVNVVFTTTVYNNTWNGSRQAGTRIFGNSTQLGGNFWAFPNGTGYSETCADVGQDGFCDSPFDVFANASCVPDSTCTNNTDYLPLTNDRFGPNITLVAPGNALTTDNATQRFNWTAVDMSGANIDCNLTVDGVVNQSGFVLTSGDWRNVTIEGFIDGAHYWNVTCADPYNNRNTSVTWNFTLSSQVQPNTPIIVLIANETTNYTDEYLNCSATLSDNQSNAMNVTVEWFRNGTMIYSYDYNQSYANGTFFTANLSAANTTKTDVFSCSMRLWDSMNFSAWGNSSNLTIRNNPPSVPALYSLGNNNHTTNRTQNLVWNASVDLDNDVLWYNLSIEKLGGDGTCAVNDNRFNSTPSANFTPEELLCLYDEDYYYNWSVYAFDGDVVSANSTEWNFSIDSYVSIMLLNNTILFGDTIVLGETRNTTREDLNPFLLANDGNVYEDINISGTSLWVTSPSPTNDYQFKANDSFEGHTYNDLNSVITWTSVPLLTGSVVALGDFEWHDNNDTARVDVKVTVPIAEIAGNKSSTVTFEARRAS